METAGLLRVGVLQGPAQGGPPSHMLAAMDRAASGLVGDGPALLIMPELFLTGYNIGADRLAEAAEAFDGPSAQRASAIARRHGTALLYGYPERGADGKLYNSALLVGGDGGMLANTRKLHLFGDMERTVFTPGARICELAVIGGLRVGVLICYDVEFPETVRSLALQGADLVAVPTALMRPYDFVARVLVRARAYENQVFVAYANRTGSEGALDYVGESCIIAPDGAELARAGAGETVISATLDGGALAASRVALPYLADRRPDIYPGLPS